MNEVYKLRHAAKSASFEVFRKGMVMIMENVPKTIVHPPVLTSYIEGKSMAMKGKYCLTINKKSDRLIKNT